VLGLGAALLAGASSLAESATRLESLIEGLRAMPGFSARFEEEKHIALLREPLRSHGSVSFVPPDRLLRRVDEPEPSLLRLEGDELVFADAQGSERFDLGAVPIARVFARTFTDVLAGDLERLRAAYAIDFRPEGPGTEPWRLELRPRDADLARAVSGIRLRGRGLALVDLEVREASGDATLTRFTDVDPDRRFSPAEIDALLRRPGS
jgi:hypothetical protein